MSKASDFRQEEREARSASEKAKPQHANQPAPPEARNLAQRVEKKNGAVLEDAPNGKPSRKSTRKSSNHGRQDNPKQQAVKMKLTAPAARASRAQTSNRGLR